MIHIHFKVLKGGWKMRYLTAGESHGPQLTTIIEGLPAGMPITNEDINEELGRRQKGMVVDEECRLRKIRLLYLRESDMATH